MEHLAIECMRQLIVKREIKISKLALANQVADVSIENVLRKIRDVLDEQLITENDMIYVTDEGRKKCYRFLISERISVFTFYPSYLRHWLLFIKLVIFKKDNNLQELADELLVSKNTALADIKKLKQQLQQEQILLEYSRKKGYHILGAEFDIRNHLAFVIKQLLNLPYGALLLEEKELLDYTEIFFLKKRLEKVEKETEAKYSDETLEDLPILLYLLISRAKLIKESWHFQIEQYDIQNTKEYPIIANLFWNYKYLSETDILYLVLQVCASNVVAAVTQVNTSTEISKAIKAFICYMEESLAIQFVQKNELEEKLKMHLLPAIYRNLLGLNIKNPLTDVFIAEYQPIYRKVAAGSQLFEKITGRMFADEEIVYLAMIVLGWIYQTEDTPPETIFKGVVLCKSGTSISTLLLENLKKMFPTILFIGVYSARDFERAALKVDFVFTTVPIQTKMTTFLMPSMLDKQARNHLKEQVKLAIEQDISKKARELYSYLHDLFPEIKKETAYQRIEQFYELNDRTLASRQEGFSIQEQQISVVEELKWETLLDTAFKPLLKRESIQSTYLEQCKELFKNDYPYMIIAPRTYLPHASPKVGVNRPDFQIVLTKKALYLPNGEELKMVIALAPSEKNIHVKWLLALNEKLLQENVSHKIEKIKTKQELYRLLGSESTHGF